MLVSAETVQGLPAAPGDLVNLRLQDGRTKQLVDRRRSTTSGIANEFPTAPKDSFLVANADYVAAQTGSDAVGAFLVDTGGRTSAAVADRIRSPARARRDGHRHRPHPPAVVGSSLTAVDLAGLTRVELGFALVLAAAAGGLVLALGLAERRRTFAIATALGASGRQLRGFVAEAAVLVSAGRCRRRRRRGCCRRCSSRC